MYVVNTSETFLGFRVFGHPTFLEAERGGGTVASQGTVWSHFTIMSFHEAET